MDDKIYISETQAALKYEHCPGWFRWKRKLNIGFPEPIKNGRSNYYCAQELENYFLTKEPKKTHKSRQERKAQCFDYVENKRELYWTAYEVCAFYGCKLSWLGHLRLNYRTKEGPPFIKIKESAFYPKKETAQWFELYSKKLASISDSKTEEYPRY